MTPEITVTVTFHHEGVLANAALSSLRDLTNRAEYAGLTVEAQAVLDCADDVTRRMVKTCGTWLTRVRDVAFGDPALARNAGVAWAQGRYLAFVDGDDLWGEDWLVLAHKAATAPSAPAEAIWHPKLLYYFYESDFGHRSNTSRPLADASSFYMIHASSDHDYFDANALLLNNLWTANGFTSREVHARHPYRPTDRCRGLGVEDWSWNLETLWAGIPHLVVADTVHLIRVKETDSIGRRAAGDGLLPYLPAEARPRLCREDMA